MNRLTAALAAFVLAASAQAAAAQTGAMQPGQAGVGQPQAAASGHAAPGLTLPQALTVSEPVNTIRTPDEPATVSHAPAKAAEIALRRAVSVTGDTILLRDLFSGLDGLPAAEQAVAVSPAAGERLVLTSDKLVALAKQYKLDWTPIGTLDRTTVTRDSMMVGNEEILAALRESLISQGLSPDAEIDIMGGVRAMAIPADTLGAVNVLGTELDRRSGRFTAMIEIPAGTPDAKRLRLSGRAYATLEVPVLTHPVDRKTVITDADVDWVRLRAEQVMAGVATDLDSVIGMETKRGLRAGEPLRVRDLDRPALVEKGQMVAIIVKTSVMTLTAQGKALESGAKGDVVRIENLQSRKTISGRVLSDRTVVVDSLSQTAALD